MSPIFKPEELDQIENERNKIEEKYNRLLLNFISLKFTNPKAYEHARHGFVRRIKTLKRCIQNIFNICPATRTDKPNNDDLVDVDINLQSFVINVFGCLDNLAWIWALEKQIKNEKGRPLPSSHIGRISKTGTLRQSFSINFQNYLNTLDDWFKYLEDYRHALAHRIPLYVPPFYMNKDEEKTHQFLETEMEKAKKKKDFRKFEQLLLNQSELGHFLPCMTHSVEQPARPILFHLQTLSDWNIVVEIGERFLKELN